MYNAQVTAPPSEVQVCHVDNPIRRDGLLENKRRKFRLVASREKDDRFFVGEEVGFHHFLPEQRLTS
jgi:hypothetical protein